MSSLWGPRICLAQVSPWTSATLGSYSVTPFTSSQSGTLLGPSFSSHMAGYWSGVPLELLELLFVSFWVGAMLPILGQAAIPLAAGLPLTI